MYLESTANRPMAQLVELLFLTFVLFVSFVVSTLPAKTAQKILVSPTIGPAAIERPLQPATSR